MIIGVQIQVVLKHKNGEGGVIQPLNIPYEVWIDLYPLTTESQRRNGKSLVIDACSSAPCLNAGTCIVSPTQPYLYTCQCGPGYTGVICHRGLNKCAGNPCVNGACVDNIGSFRCNCFSGFTGKLCETDINECQNSPCQNGGFCYESFPGFYACQCPKGYRGFQCETDIDECLALSPCQNGGMCRQGPPGTYDCICPPGFTGSHCEDKIPECSPHPCQNGGRCVEGEGFHGFQCICITGFTGRLCEKEQVINDCTRNASLCGHNGQCIPLVNAIDVYGCLCSNGMMIGNRSCDENSSNVLTFDPCKSSPCQNGGRCKSGPQGFYRCQCKCGYTGPFCQSTIDNFDNVANNRCQNGGVCIQTARKQLCICPSNYTGENCEVPLTKCTDGSNPCPHNATCIYNQTEGKVACLCRDGFTGNFCQLRGFNNSVTSVGRIDLKTSAFNPTILIVTLSTVGAIGILVGVAMLSVYFCRRKRPKDLCASIPPGSLCCGIRPDATTSISAWFVNNEVQFNSEPLPQSTTINPPLTTFYPSLYHQRRDFT